MGSKVGRGSSRQCSSRMGVASRRKSAELQPAERWGVPAKMIPQKTRLVDAIMSNIWFWQCKFYAEGVDLVSSEPPLVFFIFLRSLAFTLASRTTRSRSVDEAKSGPQNGVYSTRTLGADSTEEILTDETTGSPKSFSPGTFFACCDL